MYITNKPVIRINVKKRFLGFYWIFGRRVQKCTFLSTDLKFKKYVSGGFKNTGKRKFLFIHRFNLFLNPYFI